MKTTINGRIIKIGEIQEISQSFRKRELVIKTTDTEYPQTYGCEVVQNKVGITDPFKPGDMVTAQCDLQGREWTSPSGAVKYFISLKVWALDTFKEMDSAGIPEGSDGITKNFQEDAIQDLNNEQDPLPF